MFGLKIGKKWQNQVLVEGEKEAMVIANMEGLPKVDPSFNAYPVDITLPQKRTFKEAVKKAMFLSERCMYNLIVRSKD